MIWSNLMEITAAGQAIPIQFFLTHQHAPASFAAETETYASAPQKSDLGGTFSVLR